MRVRLFALLATAWVVGCADDAPDPRTTELSYHLHSTRDDHGGWDLTVRGMPANAEDAFFAVDDQPTRTRLSATKISGLHLAHDARPRVVWERSGVVVREDPLPLVAMVAPAEARIDAPFIIRFEGVAAEPLASSRVGGWPEPVPTAFGVEPWTSHSVYVGGEERCGADNWSFSLLQFDPSQLALMLHASESTPASCASILHAEARMIFGSRAVPHAEYSVIYWIERPLRVSR